VTAVLAIAVWYCIPVAAVLMSTAVISVRRRRRGGRRAVDGMAGYNRFRDALARGQSGRG
jgi:hypothetical protein